MRVSSLAQVTPKARSDWSSSGSMVLLKIDRLCPAFQPSKISDRACSRVSLKCIFHSKSRGRPLPKICLVE